MGAAQSTSAVGSDVNLASQLVSRHAYQILRVHPNSPMSEVRVFPYFDYIIAINGVEVSPDIPNIIGEMARNHVNKPLQLSLYNSRQDEHRLVTVVPRAGWGGDGLLGCAIRLAPLEGVRDRVWHILKVNDSSPAQKAGLKEDDYIIASPDLVIRSEDDFYQLITQNTRRSVRLIVFNANEGIKEVTIVPDFEWGGEGCLGCDVGAGMVHWIPKEKTSSTDAGASAPSANMHSVSSVNMSSSPPSAPSASSTSPTTATNVSSNPPQPHSPVAPGAITDPVVHVNVPASRPVIDNLFSGPASQAQPPPTADPNHPSLHGHSHTPAPPIPLHPPPHSPKPVGTSSVLQQSYKNPVKNTTQTIFESFNDEDIPKPNFSVPSEIVKNGNNVQLT